jgi:hypothetical protein
MADCKKRKAGDDPHPDTPRLQTPRRQERPAELQEIEHRWLYSNDNAMPAVAGADSSLHPAGFSFQDLQQPEDEMERWLLSGQDDDAMPAAAGADNNLHPAGFFFQDLQQPEDEMERWLLSGQDDDAMPAAADSSLHPAGFSFQDLQQPERWWLSDQDDVMPPDGSVDPASFSDDILFEDFEEFRRTQQQPLVEDEYEEVMYAGLFADDDMDLV